MEGDKGEREMTTPCDGTVPPNGLLKCKLAYKFVKPAEGGNGRYWRRARRGNRLLQVQEREVADAVHVTVTPHRIEISLDDCDAVLERRTLRSS